MAEPLAPTTALGDAAPRSTQLGPFRIDERFNVALASVACRRGRDDDLARAAQSAGVPLPPPASHAGGAPWSAFWIAPGMWMIEAPFDSHQDIVAHLRPALGDCASITEQTDAWVRLDLSGAGLCVLFERLTNLDLASAPDGHASRTVIEHLGCYLIRHGAGQVTLYGPRSSAGSLWHALEVAARSVI